MRRLFGQQLRGNADWFYADSMVEANQVSKDNFEAQAMSFYQSISLLSYITNISHSCRSRTCLFLSNTCLCQTYRPRDFPSSRSAPNYVLPQTLRYTRACKQPLQHSTLTPEPNRSQCSRFSAAVLSTRAGASTGAFCPFAAHVRPPAAASSPVPARLPGDSSGGLRPSDAERRCCMERRLTWCLIWNVLPCVTSSSITSSSSAAPGRNRCLRTSQQH